MNRVVTVAQMKAVHRPCSMDSHLARRPCFCHLWRLTLLATDTMWTFVNNSVTLGFFHSEKGQESTITVIDTYYQYGYNLGLTSLPTELQLAPLSEGLLKVPPTDSESVITLYHNKCGARMNPWPQVPLIESHTTLSRNSWCHKILECPSNGMPAWWQYCLKMNCCTSGRNIHIKS